MISIRYGDYVATYDDRGWSSSDPGLAEMLNALRRPAAASGDGDPHLAVAKNAIALLRAGEIIEVAAARPFSATV